MHFMNLGHTYENTARLAHALTDAHATADTLPTAYRDAIATIRPLPPAPGGGIAVSYEDGAWARFCTRNAVFGHIFHGATQSDTATRAVWDATVAATLTHLNDVAPDLRRMTDLLVTDVVVLNSGADGGGSASRMPGVVVMSPGRDWGPPQYAECLVHETMHLNLFVADMVHQTFTLPSSELGAEEHRALSAVKIGQRRPLDKAFHAAVVTVPLMHLQERRGVTTLVDLYTKSLRDACDDLLLHQDTFTPYGRMLLHELCGFADAIDFDRVEHAISSPEFAHYTPAAAV